MTDHKTAIVDELPPCDFCKERGLTTPASFDGRIRDHSSWANMCTTHYAQHGLGELGLGKGQALVLRSTLLETAREILGTEEES